ncbi:hypothetical protein [Bacillus sp. Marseille-Q1617]|uniref:hypothetical protein n=1 Tax=Bacillus sp. Marseille-Q1617 TaxID=2736887 RepID=UPI00158B0445|nr:hypothetical protein [Bacillus sp. Marseille-Q1617]
MLWVFIGMVVCLLVSYIVTIKSEEKEVTLENVDTFIVTAILSTLAAHGVISLFEARELEGENLMSLKENLLKNKGVGEHDWDELVSEHLEGGSPFVESKDLDMG